MNGERPIRVVPVKCICATKVYKKCKYLCNFFRHNYIDIQTIVAQKV